MARERVVCDRSGPCIVVQRLNADFQPWSTPEVFAGVKVWSTSASDAKLTMLTALLCLVWFAEAAKTSSKEGGGSSMRKALCTRNE